MNPIVSFFTTVCYDQRDRIRRVGWLTVPILFLLLIAHIIEKINNITIPSDYLSKIFIVLVMFSVMSFGFIMGWAHGEEITLVSTHNKESKYGATRNE